MTAIQTDDSSGEKTLDARDVRALTEQMTVMEHVGLARGADGLFLVSSASGGEYVVDVLGEHRCTCPDHARRGVACKHLRAVTFTTGMRPIPAWVDRSAICDQLLAAEHVDGSPRFTDDLEPERECEADTDASSDDRAVATDGGRARPVDCCCVAPADRDDGRALPCWPCYRAGFRAPNPDAEPADANGDAEADADAEAAR